MFSGSPFSVQCGRMPGGSEILRCPSQNSEWTLLTEYEIGNNTANLQAMCSTDKYVICLINASNAAPEPDTLVAFIKGSTDENGNEVRPLQLCKICHGDGL